MRALIRSILVATLLFGAAFPSGLSSGAGQNPVIQVRSSLVRVPVSVTDMEGHAVLNLRPEDFVIEEDGRAEDIARLSEPGCTAIELALLIDLTGSVKPRFDFEIQAAVRFLRKVLRPEDSVRVVSIGARPNLLLARTQDAGAVFTSLFSSTPAEEATAYFDSLVLAARLLYKDSLPDSRRVILALSDGEDNYSEVFDLAGSIREMQAADCIYYSINPIGPSIRWNKISTEAQEAMHSIADQTGGTAFQPSGAEELEQIYGAIAADLRAQYVLEYYSTGHSRAPAFRRITVRSPSHPNLRIRSRQGYFNLGC